MFLQVIQNKIIVFLEMDTKKGKGYVEKINVNRKRPWNEYHYSLTNTDTDMNTGECKQVFLLKLEIY